jgi:hypothetical protein
MVQDPEPVQDLLPEHPLQLLPGVVPMGPGGHQEQDLILPDPRSLQFLQEGGEELVGRRRPGDVVHHDHRAPLAPGDLAKLPGPDRTGQGSSHLARLVRDAGPVAGHHGRYVVLLGNPDIDLRFAVRDFL